VISDVPKTMCTHQPLPEFTRPVIPEATGEAALAELRPDKRRRHASAYDVLDTIRDDYVEECIPRSRWKDRVRSRFDPARAAQGRFAGVQTAAAAPGLRFLKSFGYGRRFPIAANRKLDASRAGDARIHPI